MTTVFRYTRWLITGIVIILLMGIAGAVGYRIGAGGNADNSSGTSKIKTTTASRANDSSTAVVLYFADSQGQYLLPESREISSPDMPKAAIAQLIKGPKVGGHNVTVPASMVIQSVKVENGLATVDFGAAFNALIPPGTAGERLFIYSIVDTLTGLKGITKVKFMAGASPPDIPGSHTDFNTEFTRSEDVIKQ